jgi:hypothetical protein
MMLAQPTATYRDCNNNTAQSSMKRELYVYIGADIAERGI